MLKETFKMRKIGKHLVNVSVLSLAIAPVVVSGVQPVFAEERVANAETAYPTKIENDMTPSNTPDAKGTYNSQIKSIELVSQSGNAYRYKVTLHDGYSVPEGGVLRFKTNIAYDALSIDAVNVLNSSGSVIGRLTTSYLRTDESIDTVHKFNDIQTVSEYSSLWKSLTSRDYAEFIQIDFMSNDLFSKTNTNRSFEFVINVRPYYEYGRGSNGYDNLSYVSKPANFDSLFPDRTFNTGIGFGDKYVKSGDIRTILSTNRVDQGAVKPFVYNTYRYQIVKDTIDSDSNKPQWIEPWFGLNNGFIYTISSHSGWNTQDGQNKALYLKKGDVIRYKVPEFISLKYKNGVSVGDSLSLIVKETTPSSYIEKKNRFSDTTDYKVFERVRESEKKSNVSFKLTKLEDSLIEGVVEEDVYINPKTALDVYLPFNDNNALKGVVNKVGLNRSITSILTKDDLKEFTESSDPEFRKLYNDTGVSLIRDGSVLGKSNDMSIFFRKNRNIATGDQTNGTVKVKYVDESGTEIPGNPIETIAENKPWYEQITITPKEIKGYKFVKANKDLKLAVGTGEDVDGEIVVTYIPDPENEPGKQTVVDEGSKPKLDVTGKVKDPGKPKVIKVGTKPKVVEEEIPFKEEVRENPKLPKGTENVIQEGEKGKKTTTTTYTIDPKTGEVKPTEKVTTKDPKTRIVERGTGEDKDGDLIVKYIPDPEEEPGKQTVVDEGKKPKFDVTGKEIDPGSPKVIKVGTKPKVVEEEVPFKEEVRENPELPEGERKVIQEGRVGKKTTITTYTLDEKTGKVKESTTEKVDEPKVQIVEVGTKKPEVPKEEPKVETPKTTEVPKKEEPKVEQPKTTEAPKTEQPKTTEEPKAKETPKQLPKTSEQAKQRNTAIIAMLSVVGLGGLATYLGLRKRDEK